MEPCWLGSSSSSSSSSRSSSAVWMLILVIATVHHPFAAVASVPSSVCSYLCTCTNQNFATVDCAFDSTNSSWTDAASFVLDEKLLLPTSATALNIKLIAGGQLVIKKDFFKQNNINHLSIDGSESRTGSSDTSVQFHEGALCNNNGQFPEIVITNIGRLEMRRNISCRAHLLNITHVKDVLLKTEFLTVDEAEVLIQDVSNLQIEPNAFGGSTSSKIEIYRTTIESLPKLGASFRLLSFNECNISEIVTHAFDANEVGHVEFVHCRLTNLRQKAVTERLLSDSFIFRSCYIHRIEKQFVDGSGLKNLLLESNTIDEIAADAFTFTSIFTIVTGNHVIRTGKEWLQPKDWQNVTIAGNSFGEFNGITLWDRKRDDADRTKAHCYFGNNTITNALPDSFTFGHSCHIRAIHFGRECGCTYDSWLKELVGPIAHRETVLSSLISRASCQVEDSLRYCFNRSEAPSNDTSVVGLGQVNVQYFLMEFCKKEGSKKCSSYTSGKEGNRKPPPLIPLEKIDSLPDDDEDGFLLDKTLWICIALAALAMVLLLLFTVCFYRRRVNQTRQTMTTQPQSSRSGTIRSPSLSRSSFTTADRRIIASSLGWIKGSYDHKIWSEINTPMQQLLEPSQSGGAIEEQVKVRLIGSILDSLKRHEISATQIVALNDILFRQLGPPPPPELVESVRPNNDTNDELGHIYDELQLNRAPMFQGTGAHNVGLLGDYAAPLDHGGITVVPEGIYSEPVLHDQLLLQRNGDNRNLISPYAIGDATVQRNPTGTEGNLPDVILLRRPTGSTAWKAQSEEDNDDEDEDEIDGEAERKTMLRPAECGDGSTGPTYAISMKQLKRPHRGNTPPPAPPALSSDSGDDQPDGTDGNRSEHSGSSMQTVRIEDMTLADDSNEQQQQ